MSVYLDSTSVISAVIKTDQTEFIRDNLSKDPVWFSSAITLIETMGILGIIEGDSDQFEEVQAGILRFWSSVSIIPVDQQIINHASSFSATLFVNASTAIHLASIQRMPDPKKVLSSDSRILAHAGH